MTKKIQERTFTIRRGVLPSSLDECPRMIAVVGNGPQLGNFRGHYYRTECGAYVCLRGRASGDGIVSGRFVAMRWARGNADPRSIRLSQEATLFVEAGCKLVSHHFPWYGGRSTTPEFTQSAEWIAASKGGN